MCRVSESMLGEGELEEWVEKTDIKCVCVCGCGGGGTRV